MVQSHTQQSFRKETVRVDIAQMAPNCRYQADYGLLSFLAASLRIPYPEQPPPRLGRS